MTAGAVIAVVVAVVVVLAIVAAMAAMRGAGPAGAGLKRRFGPEYERTLARHDGDGKAARHELAERVRRYGALEPRRLEAQQREQYEQRWAEVQGHFVDEPGRALGEADRLIGEVAAERGYPGHDAPGHFDALSVHHPHQVQAYRRAHALAEHAGTGGGDTEDMRQALVASRELFDDLLRDAVAAPRQARSRAAVDPAGRAAPGPAPDRAKDARETGDARDGDGAGDPGVPEGGPDRHRPLADRFAALTGPSRRGRADDDQR